MKSRNHLSSLRNMVKLGFLYEKTLICHILMERYRRRVEALLSPALCPPPSRVPGSYMVYKSESTGQDL